MQTTHIWLDEICAAIGPDRQLAWKVLSTVLHKLRDRLPVELSAHLSAELPLLVRGVYYDQFEPAKQPTDWGLDTKYLNGCRMSVQSIRAMRAVFSVLSRHVPRGEIAKVQGAVPEELRAFWVAVEERLVAPPERGGT